MSNELIDVSIRNIICVFAAMNRDVANFNAKAKRNGVKASDLYSSASDTFNFRDQTASHHILERVGGDIPGKTSSKQHEHSKNKQNNFANSAFAGFCYGNDVHWARPP